MSEKMFGLNNETNEAGQENIADTITFVGNTKGIHDPNDAMILRLKKSLSQLPADSSLKGAMLVLAEMRDTPSAKLQSFTGIKVAQEFLAASPEQKILIYSMMPVGALLKQMPELAALLGKDNVRFADMLKLMHSEQVQELSNIFNQTSASEATISTEQVVTEANKLVDQKVVQILHSIEPYKVGDPYNASEEHRETVAQALRDARTYFPTLLGKTDKEVLDFLYTTRENMKRPEVMKGQKIDGVFCDIEGTLVVNGAINQIVLDKLLAYEKEGKVVTLWTDGDISTLQQVLDSNGITFPLKSKFDYAGAMAEIVIDDADENTFKARTKIYPKHFIKA